MNAADIEQICLKCMRPGLSGGICGHCGTKVGFAQEPAFALPVGSILHGRYLVGAVLGNGGFGITYIGYDLKEDRHIAIKEFLPTGMANRYPGTTTVSVYHTSQEFYYGLNKFLEEARVIYKYRAHGNIISVYALFEENNTAYYVMEYLEGCDLKQYLAKRGGVLPFKEAVGLLLPVFDALEAIHKDGLIHRDISPDNIYIYSNRQVKLLDFGAARVALMERSKSLSVILKRGYAPPEQYQTNGNQGPWTDVYALGATFYRCITGKLPPEATERLMTDTLIPPSRLAQGLPPGGNDAIVRALAVKAANRFQSAAQFKAALTQPRSTDGGNVQRDIPQMNISPKYEARGTTMNNKVLGKRFLAYLIDALLVGGIGLVIFYVLNVSLELYVILTYGVCVGYASVLEYSPKRATLGKRALHLRVGDAYGQPVPNNKIIIRNLIKYSPTLGILVGGGYLPGLAALVIFGYALFDANRQTIYDKAAGTYVVEEALGYAPAQPPYAVPVTPAQPAPVHIGKISLQGTRGHYFGVEFPVRDAVVMGRNPSACGIVFPSDAPGVSGVHCEVRLDRTSNTVQLTDRNSSYGTFVNGRKLVPGQPAILHNGDTFIIGEDNTFAVTIQ